MSELTEREAREVASAMRPQRRPLLIALAANLVLSGLLLGVPYVRGRILARETREHYVSFIQCMIGGKTADKPGLSLPRGEREHYAAKVLFANADWPLACRPALHRLRPPEATFLWPSVKSAGVDLRVAVDMVDKEIVGLAKKRGEATGRVPQRPLDALRRLQAASVLFVRAGGASDDIDNDSVVLDENVTGLATPARLPLMIGDSQGMLGWSESGVLELLAFDSHSLAYLRVDGGKLDRQRTRRNAYLRGLTRAGSAVYLAWAMPESRCAEREDHCLARPTGLARYDKSGAELEEPTWKLYGHPAERLDRALSISETGRIDFLRKSSARGGIEWIRAHLPEQLAAAGAEQKASKLETEAVETIVDLPDPPAPKAEPAPKGKAGESTGAAPTTSGSSIAAGAASSGSPAAAAAAADSGSPASPAAARGSGSADPANGSAAATSAKADDTKVKPAPVPVVPSSATLVRGEPVAVLRATQTAKGVEASFITMSQPARSVALETVAGEKPWAVACSAGAERFLAYGSSTELRLLHAAADEAPKTLSTLHIELGVPLDPDDSGADRLRLLCEEGRAQLLFVGKDLALHGVKCDGARCDSPQTLAAHVAELDAVLRRGLTLIAYQQGPLAPTIRLLRLDENGQAVSAPTVAGTCWEPLGGLCGRPILISDAQRTALLTRDGPDLLALETVNDGRTFGSLSGIAVQRALDSSALSPMQQHRRKKGIE